MFIDYKIGGRAGAQNKNNTNNSVGKTTHIVI